jgi:hypothetical protein
MKLGRGWLKLWRVLLKHVNRDIYRSVVEMTVAHTLEIVLACQEVLLGLTIRNMKG